MKEEISQQRCTVGAHGYTNNLPENRASKTNVDVIDKKVNSETTKLSTGEVRVPRWRLIIRPVGAKIIGSNEAFSLSVKNSLQKIMKLLFKLGVWKNNMVATFLDHNNGELKEQRRGRQRERQKKQSIYI